MINIKSIILAILFLYFISVIVVYFYQRKLLYYPLSPPTFTKDISGDGLIHKFETISFETSDNLNLKGWYHFKSLEKKTVLFFHGNASNLDNRIYKLNLLGNLDVNFLIIAWRGYSGNPGKPSEAGLYQDSLGALKWLNKKGISNEKVNSPFGKNLLFLDLDTSLEYLDQEDLSSLKDTLVSFPFFPI